MDLAAQSQMAIHSAVKPALDRAILARRVAELMARDKWTREELLACQKERLHATLRHAVEASLYYRKTIGHLVARNAPLEEFPVLTKNEFVANFDRIITDRRLTLAGIESHLASEHAADLMLGQYRACATGGTTGVRAVMVYDQTAWHYVAANAFRSNGMAGISREDRSVGIGAPTPQHLSCRFFDELRLGKPGVPRLDVTMPMAQVVAALNGFQPNAFSTYPSFIRRLAEEQLDGRLRILPLRICSVAEALMPDVLDLATKAWGVRVFNRYSTTETACSGSECEHHCGIHLPEDLVVFEAVDEANRPVPSGTPGCRLLVTTLANTLVPLIRYEFSDIVTIADEPCSCGRPYARIRSIEGRREEVLQLPRCGGGHVKIHAFRLFAPLTRMPGLREYQLLHSGDGITVRIAVRDGESRQEIAAAAGQKVGDVLADEGVGDTRVVVEIVDGIERSGTGAKLRLVAKA